MTWPKRWPGTTWRRWTSCSSGIRSRRHVAPCSPARRSRAPPSASVVSSVKHRTSACPWRPKKRLDAPCTRRSPPDTGAWSKQSDPPSERNSSSTHQTAINTSIGRSGPAGTHSRTPPRRTRRVIPGACGWRWRRWANPRAPGMNSTRFKRRRRLQPSRRRRPRRCTGAR